MKKSAGSASRAAGSSLSRAAGEFSAWLAAMRDVLQGKAEADVPCGGCVGCCVSRYPVPLRPGDRIALEEVPAEFLALPRGGELARMLPREDGTCPMLESERCRIYAGRPQTCRDYDCRIYAAAGLAPDGERPVIRGRVGEWRFTFEDDAARSQARAVRRAAAFIREHAALFPPAARAHSAAAVAVLAVKTFSEFLDDVPRGDAGDAGGHGQPHDRVAQILRTARRFDGAEMTQSPEGPHVLLEH